MLDKSRIIIKTTVKKIRVYSISLLSLAGAHTLAAEFTANAGVAYRVYPETAAYLNQEDDGVSVTWQAEFREKWNDGYTVLTLLPFYRHDEIDDERTHGDIRQLDLVHSSDHWEYQAGIGKVFWGVAESAHLVDIINQTDGVESLDGEEKLGQPLLRVSYLHDEATINFFILPYFRERTFPGESGRLRSEWVVDTDNPVYESSQEEKHVDYAMRLQKMIGSFDIGLSYFDGTSRAPYFIPDLISSRLKPYYPLIEQTGVDLQYTGDKWLWKFEAIYRDSWQENYNAEVGGFEYTIPGFAATNVELGLLAEYHHDSRGQILDAPFQNDTFVGARLVFNDLDAECLIGGFVDMDNQTKSFFLEFTMRMTAHFQLNIEAQAFAHVDEGDVFYGLRKDGFVEAEVKYYF